VRLYRLAVEARERGARYHAVGEEGVSSRDIAEALGRALNLPVVSIAPEDAAAHYGWMAMFVGLDMPASSARTQARLNWHPTGPTLIADLNEARYV
jgi:nucleoside-diphosphate-sugar epimerase